MLRQAITRAIQLGHRLVVGSAPVAASGSSSSFGRELQRELNGIVGEALELPRRNVVADTGDQLRALLGSERQHLHYRLDGLLDAGLLCAAAGTLRAGGVLHLSATAELADPFARRLMSAIHRHGTPLPTPRTSLAVQADESACSLLMHMNAAATHGELDGFTHHWRTEQEALLVLLPERILTKMRACTVVQGRRGRGKTALLGRLAARLSATGLSTPVVAEQSGALATLQRHWSAERSRLGLPGCDLPRLPLQRVLRVAGDTDTSARKGCLLVDEAAAIPLPALAALATRFDRLVFATTEEGYEGTGSGFALRLERAMADTGHGVMRHRLVAPVRWATGDPLEALLDHALLLDLPPASAGSTGSEHVKIDQGNLQVVRVVPDASTVDEARLRQLAALLMQAHYRTTVDDLRHLLTRTALQLHVLEHAGEAIAVALVALEGDLPNDLHIPILARRRRLPDQVLPQLLAQTLDDNEPLTWHYARVVRIAVVPALQGRGLGTHLIRKLSASLPASIDVLGASFAADLRGLRFWLRQEFVPVHRGLRRNARSGQRALCVLKALRQPSIDRVDAAAMLLKSNLAALQPTSGDGQRDDACRQYSEQDADEAEVLNLLTSVSGWSDVRGPDPSHLLAQLVRFANDQRGTIDTAAALRFWVERLPPEQTTRLAINLNDRFSALLGGEVGRRTRERELRAQVARTLHLIPIADA